MSNERDDDAVTKANLLGRIERGWNTIQAYIGTLSNEQLTKPTDAAGWTVKDHLMHMAVWEDGVIALLEGRSRLQAMEVDQATWESGYDQVNALIQQRHQSMPLDEVQKTWQQIHERLLAKINSLADEDLLRPYRSYQPDSTHEEPIIGWIVGNTFAHYAEHQPWIAAIVQGA